MHLHRLILASLALCLACTTARAQQVRSTRTESGQPEMRWWKGNLHTHSLWSDGDEFPEMIVDWYAQTGYNFLALTDHNVLSEGMRWMSMKEIVKRSDEGILERYRHRFGDAWVESRGTPGSDDHEVRLKPLDEFRHLLEQRNQFILIPAEEISDRSDGKPVHINATNIAEVIPPAGGATVREAMQNNLCDSRAREAAWPRGLAPSEPSELRLCRHRRGPGCGRLRTIFRSVQRASGRESLGRRGASECRADLGSGERDSTHLARRPSDHGNRDRRQPRVPRETGFASRSRLGHGPEPLPHPRALDSRDEAGRFLCLKWCHLGGRVIRSEHANVVARDRGNRGARYVTEFIATLKGTAEEGKQEDRIGSVMAKVEGVTPSYTMQGTELYVRAVVTSDQPHVDPSFEGQTQQAWTQPVGWLSDNGE